MLNTLGTEILLAKIPLIAGPTMAAIPTNEPVIALPLPCSSALRIFANSVKAAGVIKPLLKP